MEGKGSLKPADPFSFFWKRPDPLPLPLLKVRAKDSQSKNFSCFVLVPLFRLISDGLEYHVLGKNYVEQREQA
jgi:hypothetical protein